MNQIVLLDLEIRLYRTYEELKQINLKGMPRKRYSLYRTYEELKPQYGMAVELSGWRLYRTYEELKRSNSNSIIFVFIWFVSYL